MSTVKVQVLGEDVKNAEFPEETAPLADVLSGLEIVADDFEVTVNGEPAVEDQTVKDGDTVVLVPEVSGG